MRTVLYLVIFWAALLFSFPVLAHDSDIVHVHSAAIADVTSSLTVQGTIVVESGKLPSSAIVNQTAVWEGSTYTYNPETGKLVVRTKHDTAHNLPAIKIVKVENGKVTVEYTDSVQRIPAVVKKKIKKRK
jgi:phage baseplate assembly protein gpV